MPQDGEEHFPLLATPLNELSALHFAKALGFSECGVGYLYTLVPGFRMLSPGALPHPKQTPTQLC